MTQLVAEDCEENPLAPEHIQCGSVHQVAVINVVEDEPKHIAGVYVTDLDIDETYGATLEVTVAAWYGKVTLGTIAGLLITRGTGREDTIVSWRGSLNDTNAALDGLTYQSLSNYFGPDNVTITVSDQGYTGRGGAKGDVKTIPITVSPVNDAVRWVLPGQDDMYRRLQEENVIIQRQELPNFVSTLEAEEDMEIPLRGLRLLDPDAYDGLYRVAIVCRSGVVSVPDIATIRFFNASQQGNSEGQELDFQQLMTIADGSVLQAATLLGGNVGSRLSHEAVVGLGAAALEPELLRIAAEAARENKVGREGPAMVALDRASRLWVRRGDPGGYGGQLHSMAEIDYERYERDDTNNGPPAAEWGPVVVFEGTYEDVNRALASVTYRSGPNWNSRNRPRDVIHLAVSDLGTSGEGQGTSDTAELYVDVAAVNDAPVVTVPGGTFAEEERNEDGINRRIIRVATILGLEDTKLAVHGISISDVDLNEGTAGFVRVTMSAKHGQITLTNHRDGAPSGSVHPLEMNELDDDRTGLWFTIGSGENSSYVQFVATLEEANAILSEVYYQSSPNYFGPDELSISVSDEGFSGSGGIKRDRQVIPLDIVPVNDAPTVTVPRDPDGDNTVFVDEGDEFATLLRGVLNSNPVYISAPQVQEQYSTGFEMWFTQGYRPDKAPTNGNILLDVEEQPDGGLGEPWRLSWVKDLVPGLRSSSPSWLTVHEGYLYFAAFTPETGVELFRTNGTRSGMELVKDIFPGPRSSFPSYLQSYDGKLYFSANGIDTNWMDTSDECYGFRQATVALPVSVTVEKATNLWQGHAVDRDVVRDVSSVFFAVARDNVWKPGAVYDCPSGFHWASTEEGLLIFNGDREGTGSYAPYDLVNELGEPIPLDEVPNPWEELVYFDQCGWSGFEWQGVQRWAFRFSDSHITGAVKPAGESDAELPLLDDFSTDKFAGIICIQGERSDAHRVGHQPVSYSVEDEYTKAVQSALEDSLEDSLLSTSDPVARLQEAQAMAQALGPGSTTGQQLMESAALEASRAGAENIERPDLLKGVGQGPGSVVGDPCRRSATACYIRSGAELWVSDGTDEGTLRHFDLAPGLTSSDPSFIVDVSTGPWITGPVGGDTSLYHSFVTPTDVDSYLQWVDGGAVGPSGLSAAAETAIESGFIVEVEPGRVILVQGFGTLPAVFNANTAPMAFAANTGLYGRELWASDGYADGTYMVQDLSDGRRSSDPRYITPVAGLIIYSANDYHRGRELWVSNLDRDGTEFPSRMVLDIYPGVESSNPRYMTVVGPDPVVHGFALGSDAATDLPEGAVYIGSNYTGSMVSVFFQADDGVHGIELWCTYGTADTTYMVKDIMPGAASSHPSNFVSYRGKAFFQANDGIAGPELWVSDGTAAGTVMVADITHGASGSFPSLLTVFTPRGDPSYGAYIPPQIFFVIASPEYNIYGAGGFEMWVTDGTEEGTLVAYEYTGPQFDLDPFNFLPHPSRLVEYKNSLFFSAARGRLSHRFPAGGLGPGLGVRGNYPNPWCFGDNCDTLTLEKAAMFALAEQRAEQGPSVQTGLFEHELRVTLKPSGYDAPWSIRKGDVSSGIEQSWVIHDIDVGEWCCTRAAFALPVSSSLASFLCFFLLFLFDVSPVFSLFLAFCRVLQLPRMSCCSL